jgi:ATP-dependent Clp protease adaptor protein ClpS
MFNVEMSMKLNEIHDDGGTGVIDLPRQGLKPELPPMFHVFLNNDDYVSGEAVLGALQETFGFDHSRALQMMVRAHREGKAEIGTFSRDVAETKAATAVDWVRKFHSQMGAEPDISPHVFTVEPAE